MSTLNASYKGLNLLMRLNLDALLAAVLVGGSLYLGTVLVTF